MADGPVGQPWSEHRRRDRVRRHTRLADVLGQSVHDRLVQVFDDAVVRAVDVNADLGYGPGVSAVEAGQRDRAQAMCRGPR